MKKHLKLQGYMPQNKPYLVIAQSGRALAASASNAGIETHVIDRFADVDTQIYALSAQIVNESDSGICADHLKILLDNYDAITLEGVVVGSGLECQTDILSELDERFRLFGNTADCVKTCKDPKLFFALLESLGIPYPTISLESQNEFEGWLVKKIGGTGGQHIHWADGNKLPKNHYYQKFIEGHSISVTFLANGKQAHVIGINETWVHDLNNNNFCYAGASTVPEIGSTIADILNDIVDILVHHLQLVGVCGLDVIIDQSGACYVLEVNPRPVATFEFYEQNQSLFYAHVEACRGKLEKLSKSTNTSQGHEILFLTNDFVVPELTWPEWVNDRPNYGLQIASGEPICTIRAVANSPEEIKALLKQRKSMLNELLGLEKIAA
jgi:predicted ATP-grasp superfamily ATP-dependent carboligase